MTAVDYARRGWHVFPVHTINAAGNCTCGKRCDSAGKHPMTRNGLEDATSDVSVVERWEGIYGAGGFNIGIRTGAESGLVVLDVDGDEGRASLKAQGPVPRTPTVRTGKGGHLYFRHPGARVKNGVNVLPGLDVRGDGGYVVAPPSRHANGVVYSWAPKLSPGEVELDEPPAWLAAGLNGSRPSAGPPGGDDDVIPEGQRNDVLFRMGCAMRRHGAAYAAILAALRDENARRCRPPLPDDEVERIARSAAGYEPEPASTGAPGSSTAHREWPAPLDEAAFHGLAGRITRAIEPTTEADPVAILLQVLVFFGNAIGRDAHFTVEADRHSMNEYVVVVGETSKARKGTAMGRVRGIFEAAYPDWARDCIVSGLSSGEGLIWEVRDPIEKLTKDGGFEVVDPGVDDKRRLVFEAEFASVLRRMDREGNSLSAVLRDAWDGRTLNTLVKTARARSTGAHISIIGNVTRDEVTRYLTLTEAGNGFGNRIMWACARRARVLPMGGEAPNTADLVHELRQAIDFARGEGEVGMHAEAYDAWCDVYGPLSEGKPGLLGAILGRAEAHVRRWAVLYALMDRSAVVRLEHLEAALAVWDYCDASARYIFGEALGDPTADTILAALRQAPDGLTREQIRSDVFGRHKAASEIARALAMLLEQRLVAVTRTETGGRPAEVWRAA